MKNKMAVHVILNNNADGEEKFMVWKLTNRCFYVFLQEEKS